VKTAITEAQRYLDQKLDEAAAELERERECVAGETVSFQIFDVGRIAALEDRLNEIEEQRTARFKKLGAFVNAENGNTDNRYDDPRWLVVDLSQEEKTMPVGELKKKYDVTANGTARIAQQRGWIRIRKVA
jgi:hypothetical protein